MVHSRQPQIDTLKRVNVKGCARFIDNSAARNLENAIQKKTQSEVILRQLGLTPEKSLVDKVTELLELSQTLDSLNPVAISPETSAAFVEALDGVSESVSRLRGQLDALDRIRDEGSPNDR
jgi:hypothetical protein